MRTGTTVIEVNLDGVFRLCRAAGRHMLATGRGGKIINIASLLSFQGGLNVPAYAAVEERHRRPHQRVVERVGGPGHQRQRDRTRLLPHRQHRGRCRADETRNRQILERIPAGRWGEPADLVGAAVFLASRASDYVNGHVLAVDGGWLGR